jgi:hypothetical protein
MKKGAGGPLLDDLSMPARYSRSLISTTSMFPSPSS